CTFITVQVNAQLSFNILPNQPPANFYSVVTDPTNNDIYACTENKVFRSVDQGANWTQVANSGMNFLTVLYFSPSGQLYAGANHTNAAPLCGITKYDKINNSWTAMLNSPQNVTAITEDAVGNIFAGTGTTANIVPNPINFGAGVYMYNGTAWATANAGMNNLAGYSVLPFIKDLKLLSNGDVIAATYGNGVLKYNSGSWSQYGNSISNLYVNCLYLNASGLLYAGTDVNISLLSGSAWSIASNGLTANKPVRSIAADATGKIYAGLGFHFFQKGSIAGEIYYTSNNGALWQNAGAGFNSTSVVAITVSNTGNLFAAACGIWKAAIINSWNYSMNGMVTANNTVSMVENAAGDWFVTCRNPLNTAQGTAGIFRSSDKGITWTSINNGINCQRSDVIFVDSYGWLWYGAKEFIGASASPAYGNPELYKSADNGNTWVRETTILQASESYVHIAEDKTGKLFVTNGFGTAQTNISSSFNHAVFDNTLYPPPNNGFHAYGLAINSLDHVFFGSETAGLSRSTTNGAPGSFISVTNGAAQGPVGNVSAYVDPNTDYIFSGATHGQVNGSQVSKNIWASSNIDDGYNMFMFNNLPDFASLSDMTFDNRGNAYMYIISGLPNTTQGLYVGTPPWNSSTVFNRIISFSSFSYYFLGFMTDECGYLYGMNGAGSGIYRSALPLNTPLQSTLISPANNATGVSLTATFTWAHKCIPDSFRIQVATDSLFTAVVKDQSMITATAYAMPAAVLAANTKYYWRIYGVNAAGVGKWSATDNFTTTNTIPLSFLSFDGNYDRPHGIVQLQWSTTNEMNNHHFLIERAADGINFHRLDTVPASPNPALVNNYSVKDISPATGNNFYRLAQIDIDGHIHYYKIISINTGLATADDFSFYPNPAGNRINIQLPQAHHAILLNIENSSGIIVLSQKILSSENNIAVDISRLKAGIYILKLLDQETGISTNKKLIKRST
ncbi:MAG: T9SS type A sorting domain-containing protein, partial [Ferruginibacter sp.]